MGVHHLSGASGLLGDICRHMALPPTRLTILLSQVGSDPARVARALEGERLLVRGTSPTEVERMVQGVLDELATRPPHPGPTWADLVSGRLQHASLLNRRGVSWATGAPVASPPFAHWAIVGICCWWALACLGAGLMLVTTPNPGGILPWHLGASLLAFGVSALIAAIGTWRRVTWASTALYTVGGLGLLLNLSLSVALWGRVPSNTILVAAVSGALVFVVVTVWAAHYVIRVQ